MSTAPNATPALFSPIKVGNMQLQHRIALPPLTRFRSDDNDVPTDLMVEHYAQRASTPGTLLIAEGTIIAPQAGGYPNMPGIWNDEQVTAWRKVTDAVHAKSSFIFLQLGALGRAAVPTVLQNAVGGPYDLVAPSAIPVDSDSPIPRTLSMEEIKEYVQLYVQAAKNAIQAGFDGVEILGANGYLVDQFLQSNSNERTDEYGGSIENRIRFVIEIVDAVAIAIGPERTALRLSPWSTALAMRMADPIPTFSALVKHLAAHQPHLAYLHFIEPRVNGTEDAELVGENDSNDFARGVWSPRPLVLAGGFTRETALNAAELGEKNVIVAVGRWYTSNPDLPRRWMRGVELTPYERATFYTKGVKGYNDWGMWRETVE
ncbi:unnamed protein product [Peniophora sp. CBMAI 1063]|nr:unnamed protein product [Peniophora sp. CBMAI 1063]